MLSIIIPGMDFYNDGTNEFITYEPITVELEHSLVSLSKWESKFGKPFLLDDDKSQEEIKGYIEAMITSNNFSSDIFDRMTQENYDAINDYIKSPQSATTFSDVGASRRGFKEIITSEVIYYWMVAANIPLDCETWHLNRLFSLIRIYSAKNSKEKKMSPRDAAARQRQLNEERKAKLGTTG